MFTVSFVAVPQHKSSTFGRDTVALHLSGHFAYLDEAAGPTCVLPGRSGCVSGWG